MSCMATRCAVVPIWCRRALIALLCTLAVVLLLFSRLAIHTPVTPPSFRSTPPAEHHSSLSRDEMKALLVQLRAVEVAAPRYSDELAAVSTERPNCIMFRQTANCLPDGRREPENDTGCSAWVPTDRSGYCECSEGRRTGLVGCGHPKLKCESECAKLPKPTSGGGAVHGAGSAPAKAPEAAKPAVGGEVAELETQLKAEEAKMHQLMTARERLSPALLKRPPVVDDGEMSELFNHMMKR